MGHKLKIVWTALDTLYLASGIAAIIFSVFVRMGNPASGMLNDQTLRSLVIRDMNLNAAMVLGIMILASWLISVYAAVTGLAKGRRRTGGFIVFNWSLIAVAITTTIIGSIIWFFTLQPRSEFFAIWNDQPQATQQFLQDTLHCCGFFNLTTAGGFNAPSGFCVASAAGTNTTAVPNCDTPILAFEDYTLNNIFSVTYGFVAIQVALFLATCCMINVRVEEERFRLIDERRGMKGGFV